MRRITLSSLAQRPTVQAVVHRWSIEKMSRGRSVFQRFYHHFSKRILSLGSPESRRVFEIASIMGGGPQRKHKVLCGSTRACNSSSVILPPEEKKRNQSSNQDYRLQHVTCLQGEWWFMNWECDNHEIKHVKVKCQNVDVTHGWEKAGGMGQHLWSVVWRGNYRRTCQGIPDMPQWWSSGNTQSMYVYITTQPLVWSRHSYGHCCTADT